MVTELGFHSHGGTQKMDKGNSILYYKWIIYEYEGVPLS